MNSNDKEMYELLTKLGLYEDEIQTIYEENTNLKYVLPSDVFQLLKYLSNQGLKVIEIINIVIKNPWVLTESLERIDYLEKYYRMIKFEGEKYKELLIKWPEALSLNPYEVKQEIEKQRGFGKTDEHIQGEFLNNFDKYFSI